MSKLLYYLFLCCLLTWSCSPIDQNQEKTESVPVLKRGPDMEDWREMSGPEKFMAYHQAIRTKSGASAPDYPVSYQHIAFKSAKSAIDKRKQRAVQLPWVERGPANVGGRTRGIWVDPSDPTYQTLFAGSAGGGVWKTSDGGYTWENLTQELPNLATATIAGSRANPDVIYIGTGEGFGTSRNILGSGLWKSTDKGETWTQLTATINTDSIAAIYRIIANPNNEDELLFSVLSNPRLPEGDLHSDIFYSDDGGETFTSTFPNNDAVQQLVADPHDFTTIYGTAFNKGILKSIDSGKTWKYVHLTSKYNRMEMAVSPSNTNYLYFSGQGSATGSFGLVCSPDGGESWMDVLPKDDNNDFGNVYNGQGWYNNTIAVHPFDSNVVYVGGAGPILQITVEGVDSTGKNFIASMEPVTDGYATYRANYPQARTKGVHVDHHNIILIPDPQDDDNFFFFNANDGGVAISRDGGRTFMQTGNGSNMECLDGSCDSIITYQSSTGYNTAQFYGVDKANGQSRYVAGTQDNGSWVSGSDPTESSIWNAAPSGDGFEAAWHYWNNDWIIETSQFNNVFRSDNGGVSWRNISPPGQGPFLSRIASSKQDPDLIFAVTSTGVARSTNFGDDWEVITMPSGWTFEGSGVPIRISLANPNIVWTGSGLSKGGSGMTVSTNGGKTFREISGNLTEWAPGLITNLTTHPQEDSTVYFLFSQAKGPKIIRSRDLGQTFEDLTQFSLRNNASNNGFPDVATYSFLVMPYDTSILWAGTEIGLFESTDAGASWQYADNGLPPAAIWDMRIVNNEVVLATHGRGIWTVSLPELEGYEPKVLPFAQPRVEADEYAFGGQVYGKYTLRSASDSSIVRLTYEIDGEKFTHELVIESNIEPLTEAFDMLLAPLPEEEIIEVDIAVIAYQNGDSLVDESTLFTFSVDENPTSDYFNDFDGSDRDFARLDWEIVTAGGFDNAALQTIHPYRGLSEYTTIFQKPINILTQGTTVSFDEIVLVEPGETFSFPSVDYFDFCIIEATRDRGLTWDTITAYDSRANSAWLTAYEEDENFATENLEINRIFDLNDFYDAGDEVFLRFRLISDPFVEGWGWSIDDFTIGDGTVNTHLIDDPEFIVKILGNPVGDLLRVSIADPSPSQVSLKIISTTGTLMQWERGHSGAEWIREIPVENLTAGTYYLLIEKGGRILSRPFIKM